MATKIEWQASDHAAQKVLADLMKESGLSYRAMESRANAGISFVRFRDIAFGRRAPVRLTEFLAICEVCHADPVATLQRIIDEARRIQAQEAEAEAAAAREQEPVADLPPAPTHEDIDLDAWANRIRAEDTVRQERH